MGKNTQIVTVYKLKTSVNCPYCQKVFIDDNDRKECCESERKIEEVRLKITKGTFLFTPEANDCVFGVRKIVIDKSKNCCDVSFEVHAIDSNNYRRYTPDQLLSMQTVSFEEAIFTHGWKPAFYNEWEKYSTEDLIEEYKQAVKTKIEKMTEEDKDKTLFKLMLRP